jgi:5-formyltetrahydrofolate cyclo-ligase
MSEPVSQQFSRPNSQSLSKPALSKPDLRRSLLAQRRSLPPETWRAKSDRLCARLQASPEFAAARTILAYSSFRQEPDLSPLFADQTFANQPKRWGLPRCVGPDLQWHLYTGTESLQPGAYGLLEPRADEPQVAVDEVDLILVPAVAGDRRGYRLGYGAGFYDQLFSDRVWAAKPTLGILFDFALVPQLPIDPWDQPLQGICTETQLFWI